jgi:hypothetical protein
MVAIRVPLGAARRPEMTNVTVSQKPLQPRAAWTLTLPPARASTSASARDSRPCLAPGTAPNAVAIKSELFTSFPPSSKFLPNYIACSGKASFFFRLPNPMLTLFTPLFAALSLVTVATSASEQYSAQNQPEGERWVANLGVQVRRLLNRSFGSNQ